MNMPLIDALVAARVARTIVPVSLAPETLEDAFAISAAVREGLGMTVAGWKVGHSPEGIPVAAPMYASGFQASGGTWQSKPGLPMIPEVEIALRLSCDLGPRPGRPYGRDEVLEACGEALMGLELVERRIPLSGAPFLLNLADDLGNVGYVLGPARSNFRSLDLGQLRCRFWTGDRLVSDHRGGHPKGDPLVPLVDWANTQQDRLGGLRAGQIVTLGSLTPVVRLDAPGLLKAELEGFGTLELTVT